MSFFAHGPIGLKTKTLAHAIALAESGQIAHALVMWKKHKDAEGLCFCPGGGFDQVRCGFCFAGKLFALDLYEGHRLRDVPYLETARTVNRFAGMAKSRRTRQSVSDAA